MLKISVLVDNNALIGRYFLAEPGFSLWIECGGRSCSRTDTATTRGGFPR